MVANPSRRKFTLDPSRGDISKDEFSVEDIEEFLDDHDEYSPELVSVTFEVDDPVRESSTTN